MSHRPPGVSHGAVQQCKPEIDQLQGITGPSLTLVVGGGRCMPRLPAVSREDRMLGSPWAEAGFA